MSSSIFMNENTCASDTTLGSFKRSVISYGSDSPSSILRALKLTTYLARAKVLEKTGLAVYKNLASHDGV